MKKSILIFFALIFTVIANAQIFGPESINMPGTWDSFANPPNVDALRNPNQSASGDITLISAGTPRYNTTIHCAATGGDVTPGTYDWIFTSGPTGNYFNNKWANVSVAMNTIQTYTHQGGTDNSITVADGKWYTVNFEDIGYSNTNGIFMETSAQPVSLTKVEQTPATGITANDSVFVGLKLSAAPSAEEKFYVRYSTDGFTTSFLEEFVITGDSGFADINALREGQSVSYYIFSTTISNPNANFDMVTINSNNNSGANYSYSVAAFPPTVTAAFATSLSEVKVVFSEQVTDTSAQNSGNYSGLGTLTAVLNNKKDTVTLTLSSMLTAGDTTTFYINNISDTSAILMSREDTSQVRIQAVPTFQGFETLSTGLLLTSGSSNINTTTGVTETPSNQRIRTGSASWSVSNTTQTLEFEELVVNPSDSTYINFFLSSTSATSGNGVDASDYIKVYLATDGGAYSANPALTINGASNARWGFTNDGITVNYNSNDTVTASAGTNNSPIYSNIKVKIPNGFSKIQFKIEASNNSSSEFWNIDDVLVGVSGTDITPPTIINAYVASATQLNVVFSEAVDTSATSLFRYTGVSGLNSISLSNSLDTAFLNYTSISAGIPDTLTITGVKDTSGNAMASPYSFPFFFNSISSGLVISEIMYNSASTDTLEFVEVYNNTASTINLGGLYFDDAFDFTFPVYALPAGEFAVVALDTASINDVFTVNHLFQMDNPSAFGNLTNSSENVVLRNTLNQVVDSVTYDDGSPWDSRADGNGFSLELCDVNSNNTDASSWSISTNNIDGITFASPGASNACPIPIVVNISPNILNPCTGDSTMLSANATGGSTTLKYNWGPNGIFNNDTLASPTALISDTTEITVLVSDEFSSTRDTLVIFPKLVYTTNLFDTICEGDSVLLASGSYALASGTYLDTLNSALNCDSFIVHEIFVSPTPIISGFNAATPTLDGAFDGGSIWGSPIASGDGLVGWSNAEAKNLYLTRDNNYLYLGAEISAESWQEVGFAIHSQIGGDSSEVWGRSIKYLNDSLPDHVIKITFGNYGERRSWDGSAWVQNVLATADFAEDENAFVETRVLLSDIGNPDDVQVQFYITGNDPNHATFDALPTDEITTAWTGITTSLSNNVSYNTAASFVADLCENEGAVIFSAVPSGGVWTGNGFTNTSTGAYDPSGLGGMLDTLTYTYTNTFGCQGFASDTISIFSTPIASVGGDASICDGNLPLLVVASGGTTYSWNDGSTNDTLTFNSLSDSLLIITVTQNGCTAIDSAFITVNATPQVSLGNDTTICNGETVEFQINSNGNTVLWSNNATSDSVIVTPNALTTYWVELTSTDNCVNSDTLDVIVNSLPTLSIPNDTSICSGNSVSFNAVSSGNVAWSNGSNVANSGTITVTSDSTLYVVAASTQNCSVSDSIVITLNVTPTVNIVGLDTVVYGTIDTMNAVTSPIGVYTYNWSPGNALVDSTLSQVTTTNLNSTTPFSVEVTNITSGCSSSDSYTAFISGGPLQVNPTANAVCLGDSSNISANISGGTQNYTFTWTPSLGLSDSSIANPIAAPMATTKYYVTVDDGFNTVFDSITVTINSIPAINLIRTNPSFCGATDGMAMASASNGLPAYSFSWTNFGNNDTIMNLTEGTYYVSVIDANNCSSNDSISLTNPGINKPMVMSSGATSICFGDSVLLSVNNQLGVSSFQWISDSGAISGATDTSIWAANTGNYFVMLSSNCGNVNSDSISVLVNPTVTINLADTICAGDSALFNGMAYSIAGTYSDTSNSHLGCDSITNFNLMVNTLPAISFGSFSSPTIDGTLDATGAWNNPIAMADGVAGWAGVNTNNLYVTEDASNYYIAASAQVQSWQAWAFLINTTAGGGTSDSWSRDIVYGHADAPDFIYRGNFDQTANYAEFHNWNGVSWAGVGTQASPTTYGIGTDFVEVKIAKSALGNPSGLDVQFFVTGDQNSHGTFDAIPDDEVDTSWTSPTTTLMNYATPSNSSLSLVFCGNDSITTLSASPSGGTWMGNGIVNASTGGFNPALIFGNDTLTYSYTNANGCSNMGFVYVTTNPTSTRIDSAEICASDSIFLAGAWQNMAGNYVDSLQNQYGCDSILTTMLTILPSKADSTDTYICLGDSVFLQGAYRSTAGYYIENYTTTQFCDSIVTVNLMIAPQFNTNISASICSGDSLFINGTWQTTSGSYTDTLFSGYGCDSLVTTNLTVSNTISSNVSSSICAGDSLFVGGDFQFVSGTYFDTTSATAGCDSVTITQLMVLQPTIDSVMATICSGDSILLGGNFQNSNGWYVDSLASVLGCDSVVYTELMIQMAFVDTFDVSICSGDSIFLGGAFQNSSGTFQDNYPTNFGCDSSVTTNLAILSSPFTSDTATICAGDSILLGGVFQNSGGLFSDVFTANNGCDSTLETFLIVNPLPVIDSVTVTQISSCGQTDGAINVFATPGVGNLTYSIDGGNTFVSSGNFNNLSSAGYTVVVEDGGCTITDTSVVLTAPGQTIMPSVSSDTSYCVGTTISPITAVGNNIKWYNAATLLATDSIGAGNSFTPNLNLGVNTYYATQTIGSCESPAATVMITLNSNPTVNAGPDLLACADADFTLVANGASTYQWNVTIPGNNITLNLDSIGTYTYVVLGTDAQGCSNTDTTMVMVNGNPIASIGNIADACVGDSAQTLNIGLPFGGVYTGNNINNDTVFMAVIAGLDTIIYSYTDSNGCIGVDTTTVQVNGQPIVSIGAIGNFCANDGSVALTQGLPSGGFYSGNAVDSLGNFNPNLGSVGNNIISYTYSDTIGCSNSAATSVTIDSIPNVNFGSVPSVCAQGIPFSLTSGFPSGGVYSGFGVALDSIFNPSTAGVRTLTYTFTGGNGCSNSDTSNVMVDTLPNVDLGNITGICQGGTQILSAAAGFASYLWSNNSTAPQILVSSLGNYSVTVTDANGCQGSDQVNINQTFSLPNVSITPDDTTICAGDFVELKAGTWDSYQWSNNSTQPSIKVSTDGIYRVSVTNNNGCENSASTTVSLTTDPLLCGSVGLNELENNRIVSIYPNPASNMVNLNFLNYNSVVNIQLVDLKGGIFLTRNIEVSNNQNLELALENLASGVYFIHVRDTLGIETLKLIIQ